MRWFKYWYHRLFGRAYDRALMAYIKKTTGATPADPHVYRLAFRHSSLVANPDFSAGECNERLEYLGDGILNAAVASYLFQKYPLKDEGFLTEMRSKIVSRATLNDVAGKLGVDYWIEYNHKSGGFRRNMSGNALEAFVGAMYLDMGWERTYRFIVRRIVSDLNLDNLEEQNYNFKSQVLELVQKQIHKPVSYEVVRERDERGVRCFTVACVIGDEPYGYGSDVRKKVAEQKASEVAFQRLISEGWAPENGRNKAERS
ncbi:MAG: ribonuclease III [Bacteroidia bacterium]|nr:ribonuclease III [Bacteroidia bacterium]MDW8334929.1 ribonuclease III [Bacteroidia bacterium]